MSTGLPGPVCARYAHRGHQKILEGRVYRRHCCLNATHWCTAAASLYVYSLWREPRRTFLHCVNILHARGYSYEYAHTGLRYIRVRMYIWLHSDTSTSPRVMALQCLSWHFLVAWGGMHMFISHIQQQELHTFLKYIYQRTTDVDNGHLANA